MNNDRINELQDISNDFLKRLGEDEEEELDSIKNPIKTEINDNNKNHSNTLKLNMPNFSISRLYRKEKEKKPSLVKIYYIIYIYSHKIYLNH